MTKNLAEVKKREEGKADAKLLSYSGATIVFAGLTIAGCKRSDNPTPVATVNQGSGDIDILNYSYLLEQPKAAFYGKVMASPYSGISSVETTTLSEIRDQELLHRDFFKAAIGSSAISQLTLDFSSMNFSNRSSLA